MNERTPKSPPSGPSPVSDPGFEIRSLLTASALADLIVAALFAVCVGFWASDAPYGHYPAGAAAFLLYLAIMETKPRR